MFNPLTPDVAASFYVCLNDNVVTQGVANLFREDLKQAGLGSGHCGFSTPIDLPLHALAGKTLSLIDEQGLPIANASFAISAGEPPFIIEAAGMPTSPTSVCLPKHRRG
ncbi:hypothetical protein PEC18_30730 [Paucibacter sp. O1-1]|nr:hypothetical protein [Paucibacter sp. O1-1]MDA3830084.1 hypothetical protein [Paucibacter sp. O1-1]